MIISVVLLEKSRKVLLFRSKHGPIPRMMAASPNEPTNEPSSVSLVERMIDKSVRKGFKCVVIFMTTGCMHQVYGGKGDLMVVCKSRGKLPEAGMSTNGIPQDAVATLESIRLYQAKDIASRTYNLTLVERKFAKGG